MMKRNDDAVMLIVAALALTMSASAASIPDECLALARAPHFRKTAGLFGRFIKMAHPSGSDKLIINFTGSKFENPELLGVEADGPMTALRVVDASNNRQPAWVYVMNVKDQALFAGAIESALKEAAPVGAVRVFEARELDREAWRNAPASQRLNMENFYRTRRQCVAFVKDKAVCSVSPGACALVAGWVESEALKTEEKSGAAFTATLFPVKLLPSERQPSPGEMAIRAQHLRRWFLGSRLETHDVGPGPVAQVALESAMALAAQIDRCDVEAAIKGMGNFTSRVTVTPRPDSSLARFLKAQESGGDQLVRFLPQDVIAVFAHNFKITEEMLFAWLGVIRRFHHISRGEHLDDASIGELKRELRDAYINAYEGPAALAWLNDAGDSPALRIAEVFAVENADAARRMWTESKTRSGAASKVYGQLSLAPSACVMRPRADAADIGGVRVDELDIVLDPEQIPLASVRHTERLFGGPPRAHFAVAKGRAFGAAGGDSLATMKQMLDLAAGKGKPLTASPGYRFATQGASRNWKLLFYVSPSAMDSWISRFHSVEPASRKVGPGISVTGETPDGKLQLDVVAPAAEVITVLRGIAKARKETAFRVESNSFPRPDAK